MTRAKARALLCASLVAMGACASPASTRETMEGILTVLNRDPASGHGSQRIYILNADDGRRFELELAKPGSATGMDGKRVRATAATSWPVPATGAAARTRVLDIQAIDTQPRRDR